MKGFKKILALGSALGVMSSPLAAVEVYKNGDSKIDIYGSIRAYYGGGGYTYDYGTYNNGSSSGMIYGLQTNSRLGVKMTFGKVDAVAEIGASEPGINGTSSATVGSSTYSVTNYQPGFRHLWASYDFGNKGKILFGKTDVPSVANAMFVADVLNTDQGAAGFGAIPMANRKFQIRYSIKDFDIALVEDSVGSAINHNSSMPRISVAWTYKDKKKGLDIKAGGSYKRYSDEETRTEGSSRNAYHIFVAAKKQLAKNYISGMVHYGLNAANYGDQYTSINTGSYNHTKTGDYVTGGIYDTTRFGIYAQTDYEVKKDIKPVIGAGYQYTSFNTTLIHTYMVMVQLPYELHKNITITPQVGWYGHNYSWSSSSYNRMTNAFVGVVRFNYTF